MRAALLKEAFPTRQGDSHPPREERYRERRAEDPPFFQLRFLVRQAGEISTQVEAKMRQEKWSPACNLSFCVSTRAGAAEEIKSHG